MTRKIQLCLLLCTAIFATGCPKYRPSVDFNNPNSLVAKINAHITAQNNLYMAALGSSPGQAKQIRNELIENALPYIDGAYVDFITNIQAGRDRNNFMLDLVELGTAASVGITKGERPLHIIGVALTAFRGGRRSLDANFYKDQSTPILISKMDGNRAKVRATILNREKSSVDDYPLGAAVGDLVDYYNAGTLVRAFTELQKDTAIKTQESEDQVLVLKGVPLTGEATPHQRDLRVDSAQILSSLGRDLAGADKGKKDAATRTLQAIVATLRKENNLASVLTNAGVSSQDDGQKILESLITIRRSAQLVNNNSLVDKIDQVIIAQGVSAPSPTPSPASSPTPSPATSPKPSPTPSPTPSPSPA